MLAATDEYPEYLLLLGGHPCNVTRLLPQAVRESTSDNTSVHDVGRTFEQWFYNKVVVSELTLGGFRIPAGVAGNSSS